MSFKMHLYRIARISIPIGVAILATFGNMQKEDQLFVLICWFYAFRMDDYFKA